VVLDYYCSLVTVMNTRENFLRAARFEGPEWIPCEVCIYPDIYKKNPEKLDDIVSRYRHLFGMNKWDIDEIPWRNEDWPGPPYQKGEYTDTWGCGWYNAYGGIMGQVVKSPLENWDSLDSYKIPDPLVWDDFEPLNWQMIKGYIEKRRRENRLTSGGPGFIFFYHRLTFLRGFRNLMIDFMKGPPQLTKLIDMVVEHRLKQICKWLEIGVDVMLFGDDLGTQKSLQMSPVTFRKYLKPAYDRMFKPCCEADCIIYFHSDGHILELIDDFVDLEINIINPQFRANGLNGLIQKFKGRICVDLDLDRQLFPFATPQKIKDHIKEAVARLGSKEGGFMLHAECLPGVPLANIEAICQALDEYRFYYA